MADDLDAETDIVVVGGGGAGLAAAIEAASFGRSVVLLEKNETLGGTTGRSVGSVTAACTDLQRAAGIRDTVDSHFKDLSEFAGGLLPKDNLELRRVQVENAPDTISWLQSLGIVFFGPMPEPPHTQPRMHNILPHARSYIVHLRRRARRLGVDIRTSHRASRLVRSGDRVAGVAYESGGHVREIRARLGVILAAGDYSADRELKGRWLSPEIADIEAINGTATGDGHRMVIDAGGDIVNGDVLLGPEIRFIPPGRKTFVEYFPTWAPVARTMRAAMRTLPQAILRPFLMQFVTTYLQPSDGLFRSGAILVNRYGERFCDERDKPVMAIPKQPDGMGWIIIDAGLAEKFSKWPNFVSTAPGIAYAYVKDYKRNRRDITTEAPTLAELADKIGLPRDRLSQTVKSYNENVAADLPRLMTPPYIAIGPAKSWITATDGGARISTRMEVLGNAGRPIPGLYAAGSTGQGGLLVEGHGHHLGWAFTSGRLAGRNAALSGLGDAVAIGGAKPVASATAPSTDKPAHPHA